MKYIVLFSLLMSISCSHHHYSSPVSREVASLGNPLRKFLEAAFKNSDNGMYKSVGEMEQKLLKEVQINPAKFGLNESDKIDNLSKLDDPNYERVLSEVLSEAPRLLKFSSKMTKQALNAIQDHAGLAARVSFATVDVSKVKVDPTKETGLGRTLSQKVASVEKQLLDQGHSPERVRKITQNLVESAKQLSKKVKADPSLMPAAQQIIEYSALISQKTGKQFLGKGGCFRLSGSDVLKNKAEIAYRTLREVEERGLKEYKDIGEALSQQHAKVTGRTVKESRSAICALTVGACADTYSRSLASQCD